MTTSTSAIERIARVLAGQDLSSNAEGSEPSASTQVDAGWSEHRTQAVAILKSLRDAPPEIAQAGHGVEWTLAIDAALGCDQKGPGHTGVLDQVAESARHFLRAPS